MKRMPKYAALDVHQATCFASVRDGNGRVIARSVVPTDGPAIEAFFRGMRGPVQVALEECTQAQWLHELLEPLVDRVVVCDLRGEPQRGNKTDRVDADRLSLALVRGDVRPVYHGSADRMRLRELTRAYGNLVDDATRVRSRLKALFRARGIRVQGVRVYAAAERTLWLARLVDAGARFRAETLYAEIDFLRPWVVRARAAMVAEARRDPAWPVLRSIPYLGPVRVSRLLAAMKTPWRFRTKRNLWAYAGLAVVTRSSADHVIDGAHSVRRTRRALTRGLNRNHNPVLKDVFKGAATAALTRPGPFRDCYDAMLARGMRPEMARVTLARKFAAVTLSVWKKGEAFDPDRLNLQAAETG